MSHQWILLEHTAEVMACTSIMPSLRRCSFSHACFASIEALERISVASLVVKAGYRAFQLLSGFACQ